MSDQDSAPATAAPAGLRPFEPRPRLLIGLLGLFVAWIAFLAILNRIG